MILSDTGIRRHIRQGRLKISPAPESSSIQPASIDLTLDNWFAIPAPHRKWLALRTESVIVREEDVPPNAVRPYHMANHKDFWERTVIADGHVLLLRPGEFVLASTRESVSLDASLCGRVEGKSTPGRWGLIVHTTAGFIDPGFEGPITLELCNVGPFAYALYPGDKICQLSLLSVEPSASTIYAGHYQHQSKPGLPV